MNSFDEYELLTFKLLGFKRHEKIPRKTIFYALHWLRIRLKSVLGVQITYFDLRALLTPEQQKNGDLMFLTAWSRKDDRDAENESRAYRVRYFITTLRYYPELWYVRSILHSDQSPHHPKQQTIDDYMVRWGYGLNISPSFIELVNGTSSELALDAVDVLM